MPLLILTLQSNARALERKLDALARRQIPFAASQAMNRLARQIVQIDLPDAMKRAFDRPTPWVLRAFAWRKSTARSLTAEIFARDFTGKGNPAWKSLDAETFGGARRMKRFERALASVGGGHYALPGRGAKLNRYGNISQGDIEKILSALGGAENGAGYQANRTAKSARRHARRQQHYFIAHSRDDGRPIAIYCVVGAGKVEPVIVFSPKAPAYEKRFPYHETAERSFKQHRDVFLSEELAKAIATAK